MTALVYPRAFYLDQLGRGRPTGTLLEETAEQVRVEVTPADLELLRHDAAARQTVEGCPDAGLRMAARATCVKVKMATAQLRPGRYSEAET